MIIDFELEAILSGIVNKVLTMPPSNKSLILKELIFHEDSATARFATNLGIVSINKYFRAARARVKGMTTNLAQDDIAVTFQQGGE